MKNILKSAVSVTLAFLAFLCLDNVLPAPLSLSAYVALLYANANPVLAAVIYLSAALVRGDLYITLSAAVAAALIGIVFMLYNRKKRKPGVEIVVYLFLSSVIYLIFDERAEILYKLVYMAIICLFSATCAITVSTVKDKGLTIKPTKGELLCAVTAVLALSAGAYKLLGAEIFKGLTVSLVMIAVIAFEDETPALLSAAFALVFVLERGQTKYALPYLIFFIIYYAFAERNRIISALLVISAETALAFYFGFYGEYGYMDAATFILPQLVAALIPRKLFCPQEGAGYLSVGQALNKTSFNAMRNFTSDRLNDAADGFLQMRSAIAKMSVRSPSEKKLAKKIAAEVCNSCKKCPSYERCKRSAQPDEIKIERIAAAGLTKKRVSIIDVPREILDVCNNPNGIIFEVNRLIDGFSEIKESLEKTEDLKAVLSSIASGMNYSLQKISDDFAKVTRFDAATERALIKEFKKTGVRVKGLTIRGGGRDLEICLIFDPAVFDGERAKAAMKEVFGFEFENTYRTKISSAAEAACFKRSAPLSLAYGVSVATKYNSAKSGDVYSVERLSDKKIFISLSDGMGSGEDAGNISDSAITLIEAFYKAGFRSSTTLSLANKILSFVKEDDFSAVDICVIDLFDGECDFVKVGAPYGFILSGEGVRYLEGSSLPLGIIDAMSPTVASTKVFAGDMILLLTDGVTDAFGSSADMIEFLKTAPQKNPQEVADLVIKKALSLCGGTASDDMTALCARIY